MAVSTSLRSLRETNDLRHLRQIIAGLDEGVILIDPDQTLLWANQAGRPGHSTSGTPRSTCSISG